MSSSVSTKPCRLVDYFVISGLDKESGLEPDKLAGDILEVTPLERPYKSKVLAHYPEKVPWNVFDQNAVGMLCMPRGLSFRTQKHSLAPSFHSFLITREDGSKTYGSSLTFFEEVRDKKICVAMQTLQAMYLADVSSISSTKPIITIKDQNVSRSLPRSFKLTNHAATAFYDVAKDTLFVTKCITLVMQLPYVIASKKFLMALYNSAVVNTDPPKFNIESYVYNLLYEVPLPDPKTSIKFYCCEKPFICHRPGPNELPLIDYPIRELFGCLGTDKIVDIFTSILQENQILFYSVDYYKLMLVAEVISALLFPFCWQHVYVPILPASLHNFLDAPVPYVMGLLHGPEDKSSLQLPGEANLCFVDIDKQYVELPEDTVQFPFKQEFVQEINENLIRCGVKSININDSPSIPVNKNLNESKVRNLRYSNLSGTSSLPRQKDKRAQWAYDNNASLQNESNIKSCNSSYSSAVSSSDILQRSEAFQRVSALAKKTGVMSSYDELRKHSRRSNDGEGNNSYNYCGGELSFKQYVQDLKVNNSIQEIFLNRFIHMFNSYEQFVIQPNQDMEAWYSQRESMQNFDKITFLSDQPEPHLPFLSRFLETQMFTTLIDNKVLSLWEEPDPYLTVFDSRIKLMKEKYGEALERTPSYETCSTVKEYEVVIDARMSSVDVSSPGPQSLDLPIHPSETHKPGFFPKLDGIALNREPTHSKLRKWTMNNRRNNQSIDETKEKHLLDLRNKGVNISSMTPAVIAQTNWKFVEALLKECKMKTKRMLVEKMGQEAIELGHGEVSISGLEENTLIASLCDLLERVWSHGLQVKQGKSALWSHLLSYQAKEERRGSQKVTPNELKAPVLPISQKNFSFPDFLLSLKTGALRNLATQISNLDLTSMSLEPESPTRGRERERKDKSRSPKPPDSFSGIRPLPLSVSFDMRNVQAMTEIRSDIGYARAWVRLSLEKQVLSKHLKKLLSDTDLLKNRYKRYAFLRCDDEKEQFLYHLLSLNAVDYFCFTNAFHTTIIPYRVVVFPSRKLSASTTSAQAWVQLAGSRGETPTISIPKQQLQLVFQHRNLGTLTTLRIGHDNSGMSPKWMIENVLVRNEVTGHTYKFPCGRWLGKGIDDGSSERLLIGELVPSSTDNEVLFESCRTPPRCRSPNVPRQPTEPKLTIPEIQQMLGDAVNNIVKYYFKPEKERGSLTVLLCGEMGIVYCLEQVFLYGFKTTRFFKQIYLWDFFLKVEAYFDSVLQDDEIESPTLTNSQENVCIMSSYCNLVNKVDDSSITMGKDGKFQLFICLAAREHLLHKMMLHIASSPVTIQMYAEQSFLRDPNLVGFLVQILESLSDFDIILESSLTKGMNSL